MRQTLKHHGIINGNDVSHFSSLEAARENFELMRMNFPDWKFSDET
jgi:hypothetical protein